MANLLAHASSLYLRQHADNPVHWRPWDEAALAEARASGRPILLSIGYSACHWCHVMAHESFEDPATAAVINELYVAVKVDREERPDLDKIYQLAHQALTRRGGGWPLTVFLAPDSLLPVFAGTYFPPTPRHGLPAFVEVLRGVHGWMRDQPAAMREQNAALAEFLADDGRDPGLAGDFDDAPLALARQRIAAAFDAANGGHRGAPKFPHAGEIGHLLACHRDGDGDAGRLATTTLACMAGRGLHDHLGGGFFRYCVDERWDIPHFEKMLSDNALLLPVYAEAARRFGSPRLADAAAGIVGWLEREMRAPGGGFCSALDADSEGEEGRFYLWRQGQVAALLDPEALAVATRHFGLDRPPNFEGEGWHLHATRGVDEIAGELGQAPQDVAATLARAKATLLAARDHRVRPARDGKRLTAWNALLASGLARAGQALGREGWIDEAAATLDALLAPMDGRGRLPAVASGGPGFLDDHAYALQAALDLFACRGRPGDLRAATTLAQTLLRDFHDGDRGGFHFTAADHEPLPQRPKPWLDDALPAGNGVAALALARLGQLLSEPQWLEAAQATLRAGWAALSAQPQAAMALLAVLQETRRPTPAVVLRCSGPCPGWADAARSLPARGIDLFVVADSAGPWPAALASKPSTAAGLAYVCVGTRCLAPAADPGELQQRLDEAGR